MILRLGIALHICSQLLLLGIDATSLHRVRRQGLNLNDLFGMIEQFTTKLNEGRQPVLNDLGLNIDEPAKTKLTGTITQFADNFEIMQTVVERDGIEGLMQLLSDKNVQQLAGLNLGGAGPSGPDPRYATEAPRATRPRPVYPTLPPETTTSFVKTNNGQAKGQSKGKGNTGTLPPQSNKDKNKGSGFDYNNYD